MYTKTCWWTGKHKGVTYVRCCVMEKQHHTWISRDVLCFCFLMCQCVSCSTPVEITKGKLLWSEMTTELVFNKLPLHIVCCAVFGHIKLQHDVTWCKVSCDTVWLSLFCIFPAMIHSLFHFHYHFSLTECQEIFAIYNYLYINTSNLYIFLKLKIQKQSSNNHCWNRIFIRSYSASVLFDFKMGN